VRHAPCSVLVVPSHPHVRAANLTKFSVAKASPPTNQPHPRKSPRGKAPSKGDRKLAAHAFPKSGRQISFANRTRR
jgi:hypothetical protein